MWNSTWVSRRVFFLLILVHTAIAEGGCALPRSIWLKQMVQEEAPLIHGATRTALVVSSSVQISRARASTIIQSPLSATETKAWYEAFLESRGWKPSAADQPVQREYNRSGTAWGLRLWESASLEVRPTQNEQGSEVLVTIEGFYLWDIPSQVLLPVHMMLGESDASVALAELFFWL